MAAVRDVASFLGMMCKAPISSLAGGEVSLTQLEELLPLLARCDSVLVLEESDAFHKVMLDCATTYQRTLKGLQTSGRSSFQQYEEATVNPKLQQLEKMISLDQKLYDFVFLDGEVVKLAAVAAANQKALAAGDSTVREVQMLLAALSKSDVAVLVLMTWRIFKVKLAIASLQAKLTSKDVDFCTEAVQEAEVE